MSSQQSPKTISIIGSNPLVCEGLERRGYTVNSFGRRTNPALDFLSSNLPEEMDRVFKASHSSNYLILSGHLQSIPLLKQTKQDICRSFLINSAGPVRFAEYLLTIDPNVRIVLIGSESGMKGSYDLSYALSKSSLGMYVREKRVGPAQQLVLISPSTISDLGMTIRRSDTDTLDYYRKSHPKGRFATADELCGLIHLCFAASDFLTGVEIQFNGGKFARMS